MKVLYFKLAGCSWIDIGQFCSVADRYFFESCWRHNRAGFRIFQEYK
jgi:hypothetical protein